MHSQAALLDAVRRTGGLTVAATQTFQQPRSSTAERLRAQAEGRHYSTFSLYPPQELSASIATFLARLPGPEVSWVDEHLLVVAAASRPGQPEPDGPASPASRPIKDHPPRSAPGASQAPKRHPGGRAQITPICAPCLMTAVSLVAAPNGGTVRGYQELSALFAIPTTAGQTGGQAYIYAASALWRERPHLPQWERVELVPCR